MLRLIYVSLLVAATGLTGPAMAQSHPQIVTSGQGGINVAPDMARIMIGVEHRAKTAPDAIAAMGRDATAVQERLLAAGLAEKDIQTNSLQLHLEQDYNNDTRRSEVIGYVARTDITIAVYNLDTLGEILAEVVNSGADQINGLTFDVADRAQHLDAARRAAVTDARARAQTYAEAAGVTIGTLLFLTEAGASQPGPFPMEARASFAEDAVPIAAGEITISASVTVTYAIAD